MWGPQGDQLEHGWLGAQLGQPATSRDAIYTVHSDTDEELYLTVYPSSCPNTDIVFPTIGFLFENFEGQWALDLLLVC